MDCTGSVKINSAFLSLLGRAWSCALDIAKISEIGFYGLPFFTRILPTQRYFLRTKMFKQAFQSHGYSK
jgi:hypothetical protein